MLLLTRLGGMKCRRTFARPRSDLMTGRGWVLGWGGGGGGGWLCVVADSPYEGNPQEEIKALETIIFHVFLAEEKSPLV